MIYIDIHTHRQYSQLNCINWYNINLGDWATMSKDAPNAHIALDDLYNTLFSIGLHPWDIDKFTIDNALGSIQSACTLSQCKAIGEIGIDKTVGDIPKQISIFEAQLDLLNQYQRPAIIHNVRSLAEISQSIKRVKPQYGIIFHGFCGNWQTLQAVLALQASISFGKHLFDHAKTIKAFLACPVDRIYFETDASPNTIESVYQQAALHSVKSEAYWLKQIYNNYTNNSHLN